MLSEEDQGSFAAFGNAVEGLETNPEAGRRRDEVVVAAGHLRVRVQRHRPQPLQGFQNGPLAILSADNRR